MLKPWYRRLFSSGPDPRSEMEGARSRADAGDAEAQFFLGVKCSSVDGPMLDLPAAQRWYRLAAEQNHRLAQLNLGLMLEQGQGGERDLAAGRKWIRLAAEAGDAGAQFNCGNRCYRELMTSRDNNVAAARIEAYVWFELAAAQGYRGSEASRDRITVMMNHSEVAEANRRVAGFVPSGAELARG